MHWCTLANGFPIRVSAHSCLAALLRGNIMNIKSIVLMTALLGNVAFSQPSMATETHLDATRYSAPSAGTSSIESITKSQAKAAKMFRVVENFEKIDANRDGRVTRHELRLYALSTRRHVPMT